VVQLFRIAQWEIEKTAGWTLEAIKQIFGQIAAQENMKLKQLLPPFFVAISGVAVSLPVFDSMLILGRDMTLRRIQYALEALDTLGFALKKDKLKEFEKDYRVRYGEST